MTKKLFILISIFFLVVVAYFYTHDEIQPMVFDPDVSYSDPVPSITGEVNCESGKITWYVRNQYKDTLLITHTVINHEPLSDPMIDLTTSNVYEVDTIIPEELKGKEDFVYFTIYGNYRLLTEPYHFYKIQVQNTGNVSVKDCK